MSYTLHSTGRLFIAELLAGSGKQINAIIAELGPGACQDGPRNIEYYNLLKSSEGSGYAVVPVESTTVMSDLRIVYAGTVTDSLIQGTIPGSGAEIKCVTLAHMPDTGGLSDATYISTMSLAHPVVLVPGAYTAVSASISLGE